VVTADAELEPSSEDEDEDELEDDEDELVVESSELVVEESVVEPAVAPVSLDDVVWVEVTAACWLVVEDVVVPMEPS